MVRGGPAMCVVCAFVAFFPTYLRHTQLVGAKGVDTFSGFAMMGIDAVRIVFPAFLWPAFLLQTPPQIAVATVALGISVTTVVVWFRFLTTPMVASRTLYFAMFVFATPCTHNAFFSAKPLAWPESRKVALFVAAHTAVPLLVRPVPTGCGLRPWTRRLLQWALDAADGTTLLAICWKAGRMVTVGCIFAGVDIRT